MTVLVAGVIAAAGLNHWIYALAYFSQPRSPWQTRPHSLPPFSPWARIPIAGWLLRNADREAFGSTFWIRPLLIELLLPVAAVALYRTTMSGEWLPAEASAYPNARIIRFACYSVLLFLMALATFIDFDEQTIPDAITITGTWIGVVGATWLSGWGLWESKYSGSPPFLATANILHANSPNDWPIEWGQVGLGWSLWLPLGIWCMWCGSLGNLRWITRRGWNRAPAYAWVAFWRSPNLALILSMAVVGSLGILVGYNWLSPERWRGLFSSLMGIGLGGCLLWSFRIVATRVLGQQALGFGDVTLMAMVGAFLGWQPVWIAFFLAPLFGVILLALHVLLSRDTPIAFGPYLCAATAYLMFDWSRVWTVVGEWFPPASSALLYLVGLLLLLGILLWIVRWLKVQLGFAGLESKKLR
jgi:prepilin signal peptidase PulO-like enzyme (type II secretory pathway)